MSKTKGSKQGWWQTIDIPGLLGCIALIGGTYAMFWYYAETIKGNIEPGELGLQHASDTILSSVD
jgi:hypothetical protein